MHDFKEATLQPGPRPYDWGKFYGNLEIRTEAEVMAEAEQIYVNDGSRLFKHWLNYVRSRRTMHLREWLLAQNVEPDISHTEARSVMSSIKWEETPDWGGEFTIHEQVANHFKKYREKEVGK